MAHTSLVYSNNDIKAAQTGGGFSVLQLLSLPIVHTTNYFAGDTRWDLYVIISEAEVVCATSLNALYMPVSNFNPKEEMFRSLADFQNFLTRYQNSMNKGGYLKNMQLRRGRSHLSLIRYRLLFFRFWKSMDSETVATLGGKVKGTSSTPREH